MATAHPGHRWGDYWEPLTLTGSASWLFPVNYWHLGSRVFSCCGCSLLKMIQQGPWQGIKSKGCGGWWWSGWDYPWPGWSWHSSTNIEQLHRSWSWATPTSFTTLPGLPSPVLLLHYVKGKHATIADSSPSQCPVCSSVYNCSTSSPPHSQWWSARQLPWWPWPWQGATWCTSLRIILSLNSIIIITHFGP